MVVIFFLEKEVERRERLAQEEAEAMEMEDEENKMENAMNVKEVGNNYLFNQHVLFKPVLSNCFC